MSLPPESHIGGAGRERRRLREPCGLRNGVVGIEGARRTHRRRGRGRRRHGTDRREAVLDGATRVLDLPAAAVDRDVDVRLVAKIAFAVLVGGEPDPQDAWGAAAAACRS